MNVAIQLFSTTETESFQYLQQASCEKTRSRSEKSGRAYDVGAGTSSKQRYLLSLSVGAKIYACEMREAGKQHFIIYHAAAQQQQKCIF